MNVDETTARESSIFYMIGLAHTWAVDQLAAFYGVTESMFVSWLKEMDFSRKEIHNLINRSEFPPGYCQFCGVLSPETYCSETCKQEHDNRRLKLLTIYESKRIPLTFLHNVVYSIEYKRIIRLYDENRHTYTSNSFIGTG